MDFNEEQIERYSRNIILEEIGVEGQIKLLNSKILIIGTGGLGSPAAVFLAAAGIGTIGLVDRDEVELSNLQRQIIHKTSSVGMSKVDSGKRRINEMNPDVEVITYNKMATSENIIDIIRDKDYDFVIDGTDNFAAKFLINDACVMEKKPFSHAGIMRFKGQTTTYIPNKNGPCYRCIFDSPPPEGAVPTSREAGVLGVMGGVIGTIQATEAIKYILGIGESLSGYLLTYDALKLEFRKIKLEHNPKCAVCGDKPTIKNLIDYATPTRELKSGKLKV